MLPLVRAEEGGAIVYSTKLSSLRDFPMLHALRTAEAEGLSPPKLSIKLSSIITIVNNP